MIHNSDLPCRVCESLEGDKPKTHFEVIVPLYFSENHLDALAMYMHSLSERISGGIACTFVVDGRRSDFDAIQEVISRFPSPSKVILLSKNFGVGPAIHSALADSEYCITTAFGSDLQEPIDLFVDFYNVLAAGESELALGYRTKRSDPLLSKYFANFYWWINRKFIHPNSPRSGFDVFAMNRNVRLSFAKLSELNTNFTSQLLWIGFDPKWIGFERTSRKVGKSTWSHRRKFKLFADSLYGYSAKPITLITGLGFLSSLTFFGIGILTLLGKLTNQIEVPGYVMTVLLICLGQSVLLLSLGIIGGYVSRSFENSTGRPHYVVSRIIESE
jgi:hypothetical protein